MPARHASLAGSVGAPRATLRVAAERVAPVRRLVASDATGTADGHPQGLPAERVGWQDRAREDTGVATDRPHRVRRRRRAHADQRHERRGHPVAVHGLAGRGRHDVRPRRDLRRLARVRGPLRRGRHAVVLGARGDPAADQGRHPAGVLRLLVRAHRRVGARVARGASDGLRRRPAAAPARRPGRAGGGRPRLRRAARRRQGAPLRRLEPHARSGRPAPPARPAAAGVQPGAAEHHARERHRAGGRGQHGRPRPVHRPGQRHPEPRTDDRRDPAGLVAVPEGVLRRRVPGRPGAVRRAERRARRGRGRARGDPDGHRRGVDHPTPRALPGGARHDEPAARPEAAAGSDVVLSREEWYRIFTAAGHTVP